MAPLNNIKNKNITTTPTTRKKRVVNNNESDKENEFNDENSDINIIKTPATLTKSNSTSRKPAATTRKPAATRSRKNIVKNNNNNDDNDNDNSNNNYNNNNSLNNRIKNIFENYLDDKASIKESLNEFNNIYKSINHYQEKEEEFKLIVFRIIDLVLLDSSNMKFLNLLIPFIVNQQSHHQQINNNNSNNNNNNNNNNSQSFFNNIINHLIDRSNSKNIPIRIKTVHLVQLIFSSFKDNQNLINILIIKNLINHLLIKSNDINYKVRLQSISTISSVQNYLNNYNNSGSINSGNEIIELNNLINSRLIEMFKIDKSIEIKCLILKSLKSINQESLSIILESTLDKCLSVRRESFYTIARIIKFEDISIEKRMNLLYNGLQDLDKQVRESCSKMLIENWLEISSSNNIINLLNNLEINLENEKKIELILFEIFSKGRFDIDKCVNYKLINLSKEESIHLRCLIQFLKKQKKRNNSSGNSCTFQDDQDIFESILSSTITEFTTVLLHYLSIDEKRKMGYSYEEILNEIKEIKVTSSSNNKIGNSSKEEVEEEEEIENYYYNDKDLTFIQSQLILISHYLDFSDEAGRLFLSDITQKLLLSTFLNDIHLSPLLELLFIIHSNDHRKYLSIIKSSLEKVLETRPNVSSLNEIEDEIHQIKSEIDYFTKKRKFVKEKLKSSNNPHFDEKCNEKLAIYKEELVQRVSKYNEIIEEHNSLILLEEKFWIKLSYILNNFIKKINSLNNEINSIISPYYKLIQENCINDIENSTIIKISVENIILHSLLSRSNLLNNCKVLLGILNNENGDDDNQDDQEKLNVYLLTIQGLFDILLWYGSSLNQNSKKKKHYSNESNGNEDINDDDDDGYEKDKEDNDDDDDDDDDDNDDETNNLNNEEIISFKVIFNQLLHLLKSLENEDQVEFYGKLEMELKLIEGFSKLLYNQVYFETITDENQKQNNKQLSIEKYKPVFSTLVGIYFNPIHKDKPIQIFLVSFFSLLIKSSPSSINLNQRENERDYAFILELFEESFISSLQLLLKNSNVVSTPNLVKFYQYFIQNLMTNQFKLNNNTDPNNNNTDHNNNLNEIELKVNEIYYTLLFNLSLEIISDPVSNKYHCKLLLLFELNQSLVSQELVQRLLFLSKKMQKEITIKTYSNQLVKYHNYLESLLDNSKSLSDDSENSSINQDELLETLIQYKKNIHIPLNTLARRNSTKKSSLKRPKVDLEVCNSSSIQQENEEDSVSSENQNEGENESESENDSNQIKENVLDISSLSISKDNSKKSLKKNNIKTRSRVIESESESEISESDSETAESEISKLDSDSALSDSDYSSSN